MHEIEGCSSSGYCGIAPVLWTESTKIAQCNSKSVAHYLIPAAWTYTVKKRSKERCRKWFGHSFADLCMFTHLWFVVGGVVYSA